MRFEGKIFVIAGGAGGIGRAIAKRALAEGATVISWDLQTGAEEGAHAMAVDLSDPDAVKTARDQVIARFGRVDVLVCSAGVTGKATTVEEMPFAEWRRVLTINLDAVWICCNVLIPDLKAAPAGRIVNLASIAGKEGNALQSAYSAAKAGVIALTKSLGKELADSPVRVNAIAPAQIATDLLLQMPEDQRRLMLTKIPMGRAGTPEEVAAMALWLASEECSFTTGATFDLSGGRATY
ncbi:MAG: SDR family NAD(P)-dependent oxidoreductase [Pseudorhodobacter sp.]